MFTFYQLLFIVNGIHYWHLYMYIFSIDLKSSTTDLLDLNTIKYLRVYNDKNNSMQSEHFFCSCYRFVRPRQYHCVYVQHAWFPRLSFGSHSRNKYVKYDVLCTTAYTHTGIQQMRLQLSSCLLFHWNQLRPSAFHQNQSVY